MSHNIKFISFLCMILFFNFASPINAASAAKDPVSCLKLISSSLDDEDGATFEQLVNMDGILETGFDTFLQLAQQPDTFPIPPIAAMILAQVTGGGSGSASLRKLLLDEIRTFVLNGINSGAFAGRQPDRQKMTGLLSPLLANASIGKKEIHSIGSPLKDGKDWLLTFQVHDYGNDHDYPVVGRFSKNDSGFILNNIENLDQILQQIGKESDSM